MVKGSTVIWASAFHFSSNWCNMLPLLFLGSIGNPLRVIGKSHHKFQLQYNLQGFSYAITKAIAKNRTVNANIFSTLVGFHNLVSCIELLSRTNLSRCWNLSGIMRRYLKKQGIEYTILFTFGKSSPWPETYVVYFVKVCVLSLHFILLKTK